MNFKEIKELIGIVASQTSIEEVELERSGFRVRIRKSGGGSTASAERLDAPTQTSPPPEAPAPGGDTAAEGAAPAPEEPNLFYVTSPIVGTFYRAPSPDGEPFVSVGDSVETGGIVCIIEAMKLMNEIEAEVSGEIASIFVENGHPVEYGERLFAIRQR